MLLLFPDAYSSICGPLRIPECLGEKQIINANFESQSLVLQFLLTFSRSCVVVRFPVPQTPPARLRPGGSWSASVKHKVLLIYSQQLTKMEQKGDINGKTSENQIKPGAE